ncbi:MAG: type II toxin-antitoxin system RelE/ParE family toxin [Bacteroidales bacterium]|nr:type II toxin-antitoxin system RelE/ParE family toxin [Bacteroidales bacterium]
MRVVFKKDYLLELFTVGKAKKKKYSFQPQVVKQYIKTVNILKAAPNIETLYQIKSLHYEKKCGKLKDIEAVWVNDQYRLEFKTSIEGESPNIITICSLLDLSNHYKK